MTGGSKTFLFAPAAAIEDREWGKLFSSQSLSNILCISWARKMSSGSKQKEMFKTRSESFHVFSQCESLCVLLQHGIVNRFQK